ncbi:MAG: peptidase S8 [Spirochaetales bacterium]|nr:peptidase S8 [Spirochaetales bacterium]
MKGLKSILKVMAVLLGIAFCFGVTFLFKNQERKYSEITVSLRPGTNESKLFDVARKYGFDVKEHAFSFKNDNEFYKKHKIYKIYKYDIKPEELNSALAQFNQLKSADIIQTVEPNYQVKSLSNDPLFEKQWNLKQFEIEKIWKKGTGKGVTIAVIDSGVSTKLSDLSASRFVKGYNFVADNTDFEDDHGHGSHVAGTIAQDTNNGKGVAGIAYDAKIMPLKVLSQQGSGSTVDIAEAIVYAVDNGANIINMSLGSYGYSDILKDACDYAYKNNVIVVAAAGNERESTSAFPGRYDNVISVAAGGPGYELAPYSNYGTGVDIAAPGGDMGREVDEGILQNAPEFLSRKIDKFERQGNDYYYYFQGTSMASPHVAGICAILYQQGVHKPAAMRELLLSTSDKSVRDIPYINPLNALNKKKVNEVDEKNPAQPEPPRFNAGPVTVSPVTSILTLLISFALLIIFNKTRAKSLTIENINKPLTFAGLILGANGLALAGYFLQSIFPFIFLPDRFVGLLFNSVMDWDRVMFFVTKPTIFWHNFLIPVLFAILLNFHDENKRRFSVGLIIGFAAKLIGDGLFIRELTVLPDGFASMLFLIVNGIIAFGIAYILVKKA